MFKPSVQQAAYFDWIVNGRGHCILEAVAGAGKTTTILEGISRMAGKVWFGVYNKQVGDEIKAKINARPELKNRPFPSQHIDAKTFHAEGFAAIARANGKGVETKVDGNKVQKIVTGLLAQQEERGGARREDLREVAESIPSIVSMMKNRGTDIRTVTEFNEMIEQYDLEDGIPESIDRYMVMQFALAALTRSTRDTLTVDFDDMIYLPIVKNLRFYQYDWVLVDEAQDTNPMRRAIAGKLLKNTGRLVCVGDSRQAIYGFTGADNDSLEQVKRQYNAITLPLTVTYRCPKSVVDHARNWVSHITAHESAPTGLVKSIEAFQLVKDLKDRYRATKTYQDTAILCRFNKYLISCFFDLLREGVPSKIEGKDVANGLITLASRWKRLSSLTAIKEALIDYQEKQTTKLTEAKKEQKLERLNDQINALTVMIDRLIDLNKNTKEDLISQIKEMFDSKNPDAVTLCSVHKSKGMEWPTVYILGRKELMPAKSAKKDWQVEQENNLIYVAITRAKETLIEVDRITNPKPVAKGAALAMFEQESKSKTIGDCYAND